MAIVFEVSAKTGTYTDKEGKEKGRYTKMGVVMETKNGQMLKIEAIPVGWDGWAYLNNPKPKDSQSPANKASTGDFPGLDDEIEF